MRTGQDRSRLPDPLHQRALAGDRRALDGGGRAVSRATRRATRWPGRSDAGGLVSGKGGDLSVTLTGARDLFDWPPGASRPVFELMAQNAISIDDYAPEAVAEATGIPAEQIRRIAAEIAACGLQGGNHPRPPMDGRLGRKHDKMIGRPVSMHAMRGISAHSNGFQTCRMIHVLQILLGSIDCPGGFRYKPPYPKPVAGQPRPHGGACADTAGRAASGLSARTGRSAARSRRRDHRASTRHFPGTRRCRPTG
jgi:anaerobic selenocysteine-containing dehydrogenase